MTFTPLHVAIIGGGIGGLSAAISMRRQGHIVTVYERGDYSLEVGASISVAANGGKLLQSWDVDIFKGHPTKLERLIMHDYKTGDVLSTYTLNDYFERFGIDYYMFHRVDIHSLLLNTATSAEGAGTPAKLVTFHTAVQYDVENGEITFSNGNVTKVDLIIGSDGVRSKIREAIGVVPEMKPANLSCYRCNVTKADIEKYGLNNYLENNALEYWGGSETQGVHQYFKIVMGGCHDNELLSLYIFHPAELGNQHEEGFVVKEASVEELLQPYTLPNPQIDPKLFKLLSHTIDRQPWRMWIHQPYSHWVKGRTAILGDAAHPMLPNQSQGACQAIEDAAALGLIFSPEYGFTNDVEAGLKLYEKVRYDRATKVQAASLAATEDINARIGFTSLPEAQQRIALAAGKLTIDEICGYDMAAHIAELVQAGTK